MIKKFTLALASLLTVASLSAVSVGAINLFPECTGANANTSVCKATGDDNAQSMIQTIINTILMILGAVAVIMIVIGGVRYVISNGEASNLKAAKDTILYAVIGLIVAIMAYAIVNFVVSRLI